MSNDGHRQTKLPDLDLGSISKSRNDSCSEQWAVDEDREIASKAVLFVMDGARKGAVHLCSSIAQLLRENQRLRRLMEAQNEQIQELRRLCSVACGPEVARGARTGIDCSSSFHSTQSLTWSISQDTSAPPSSCSSGRGSMSPGAHPPSLPPLMLLQPGILPAQRRTPTLVCVEETERSSGASEELPRIPCAPPPRFQRREGDTPAPDRLVRRSGGRKGRVSPETVASTTTEQAKQEKLRRAAPPPEKQSPDGGTELGCPAFHPSPRNDGGKRHETGERCRKKPPTHFNDRDHLENRGRGEVRLTGCLDDDGPADDLLVGAELDTPGSSDSETSRSSRRKEGHGSRLHRTKHQLRIQALVHSELGPISPHQPTPPRDQT